MSKIECFEDGEVLLLVPSEPAPQLATLLKGSRKLVLLRHHANLAVGDPVVILTPRGAYRAFVSSTTEGKHQRISELLTISHKMVRAPWHRSRAA